MKVRDLCTRSVRTCGPGSSLADAGWAMWEGDCGILPIVDGENKVLGVVTDRDICMAVVTKARPAAQIAAHEMTGGSIHTCGLEDDVKRALETMRVQGVRRLHELIAAEPRVSATAIQTVGSKGYDGFTLALVIGDI